MASVAVSIQRNDHLAEFNDIFSELGQVHMTVAVSVAQAAVQRNAPVNTGQYRSSVENQVQEQVLDVASKITGSVFSQDDPIKVAVIEEGRGANKKFPPLDVLRRWVQLKMGASIQVGLTSIGPRRPGQRKLSKAATLRESEGTGFGPRNTPLNIAINRAAYLIGRKIAKKGIAAKHVFQKSFTETEPEVKRILGDDLSAALAKRL